MSTDLFPQRDIYTVTRLNTAAREILEANFPPLWVAGEISNLARPGSGHFYFSLKDENCQVRCAMFRSRNRGLRFSPENGMQVLAHARVGLYPDRGEFQLIVEYLEESGAGALRRAFDALKERLAAEGLFDAGRKQPLPVVPGRIGVITSPTGAAIRDILSVLGRRFPAVPVLIYPVPVQGTGAGAEIARALALASHRAECDVLILARGGGSLEDLWAFNEEVLARAIDACTIPVVSGVGHEIDFTIADFVADHRAATPSAAAELVTPDQREWRQRLEGLRERLDGLMRAKLDRLLERHAWLSKRLLHPRRRLQDLAQRADEAGIRLLRAIGSIIGQQRARTSVLSARLERHDPRITVQAHRRHWEDLARRLEAAHKLGLSEKRAYLKALTRAFAAISPQQTLARGYAIVTAQPSGTIIRSSAQAEPGQRIKAQLASGSLTAKVEESSEGK